MSAKTVLNLSAFGLALTGLVLKANFLPGANISIILSAAAMLAAVFLYGLKDNQEAGMSKPMNHFLTGSLALFIAGALFKIHHWTGAEALMKINYTLAFVLPVALIAQKNEIRISKQYCISFFTFFILLLGVIPNNPLYKAFGNGKDYTTSEKMRQIMETGDTENPEKTQP